MRINVAPKPVFTHEGGIASRVSPLEQLKRTVLACLLWESGFYESGEKVADRIKRLVAECQPHDVAALAIEAREKQRLRHAPLKLVRELARNPSRSPDGLIADTLSRVIQRADELPEFLAMYWNGDGKKPIAKQVKKGLARAFRKFDEYQLAKYNRDNAIKLRDVLFMVHAKPKDEEQAALWKRLAEGQLATPDTWEVALSAGADKKSTFERLMSEGTLGYMALLRNLRNMQEAGVARETVEPHLLNGAAKAKALPFRYVAAARAVPAWEPMIDEAMQKAMAAMSRLPGRTAVLVDVSGSMDAKLSSKSDLTRMDAACALAALVRGIADARVFSFSNAVVEVPPRNGMALIDAILRSQQHGGTYLGQAIELVKIHAPETERMIVITDEQSADRVGPPAGKGYMLNVASNENGVGYGDWTKISGFSEAVVQYIGACEQ
jgi:hypothetical protein